MKSTLVMNWNQEDHCTNIDHFILKLPKSVPCDREYQGTKLMQASTLVFVKETMVQL
jgi:hypothetical protein